jgi:hypothetical protein
MSAHDLDLAALGTWGCDRTPSSLFWTVAGSHLYGFSSADIDIDLRGAFAAPLAKLVGLRAVNETREVKDEIAGREIDTPEKLAECMAQILTTKKVESAEFTLKIPEPDKSKPGVYQEQILHFTQAESLQCKNDPKQLDCLPRAWARICAEWATSLFDEAKLPVTDGVDWRPQDTLPEDFYAA